MSFNSIFAQEKIEVYCKINFYKASSFDNPNRLNIVFDSKVRFAQFDDKTKIQKLKSFEESITTKDIVSYMNSLDWHLVDSKNTRNIGYTFYFHKFLNKSTIDFIPSVEFKPVLKLSSVFKKHLKNTVLTT